MTVETPEKSYESMSTDELLISANCKLDQIIATFQNLQKAIENAQQNPMLRTMMRNMGVDF